MGELLLNEELKFSGSFIFENDDISEALDKWKFETSVCKLELHSDSPPMNILNTLSVGGILKGNQDSLWIKVVEVVGKEAELTIPIDLPNLICGDFSNHGISFNDIGLEPIFLVVKELQFNVIGNQDPISGKVSMYLPKGINKMFGTIDGEPPIKVLKTCENEYKLLSDNDKENACIDFENRRFLSSSY